MQKTIKKPTRKEQNAIKEARLMGQIIGEFILTKPKAYKLVSEFSGEEHLGGYQIDDRELRRFAMDILRDKPRAQRNRIFQKLGLNFKLFTGYGPTYFDSRLESEGQYAQYNVTEVPFICKPKEINELFDIASNSLSFIIGGERFKETMILLKMHTFDAANKVIS
jgi:hypothetical protein